MGQKTHQPTFCPSKRLGNYCIIFGKVLSWEEIQWDITECRRLGIIERAFANLRQFGFITIRVNSKNSNIPSPTPLDYFHNGDSTGITKFIKHWKMAGGGNPKAVGLWRFMTTSTKLDWMNDLIALVVFEALDPMWMESNITIYEWK